MKLYDYTALLNVIKEVDLSTSKLQNLKEVALKNKYLELEHKLLSSGILEDWCRLNQLGYKDYYNRWKSTRLNEIYENSNNFFEYDRHGEFNILMSSGSHWGDYLCLNPQRCINQGRIVWSIHHTTSYHSFEGFNDCEREYKTKIAMIEALMETYEDYRDYMLQKISEQLNKKVSNNANLKAEIDALI